MVLIRTVALILALPNVSVSCRDDSDDIGVTVLAAEFCDGCGENSATVGDGIIFDRMHAGGLPNEGDVKVMGSQICTVWSKDPKDPPLTCLLGYPVKLLVERDRLYVVKKLGDQEVLEDDIDGKLLIDLQHGKGARYQLTIVTTHQRPFWANPPGISGSVPNYEVHYRMISKPPDQGYEEVPGPFKPICKGLYLEPQEMLYTAVIFEGDAYDAEAKTVRAADLPDDAGWFNLGCAGTAMYKMHHLRHTEAGGYISGTPPQITTVEQRQAMLRMLTAAYCDGRSFTKNGQPLRYTDRSGWHQPTPPIVGFDSIEAIWSDRGAVCLNTPRLADREDVQRHCRPPGGPIGEPERALVRAEPAKVEERLPEEDAIRRCTKQDLKGWQTRHYVLSAHPAP
jgi:hypothetical protein